MNTAKPDYLPNHVAWHTATNDTLLAQNLAQAVATYLQEALAARPRASLAVSGGRTPSAMFQALSQIALDWERVDITLVDERWVAEDEDGSNAALVKANLMQNLAAEANFVPMYNGASDNVTGVAGCQQALAAISRPVDVMILGMGNDGHTASLFPDCSNLQQAMAPNNTALCAATTAPVEPTQRMTWTGQQIHLARHKLLHLVGTDKLDTLAQALELRNPAKMPIFEFLQRPIEIYWSTKS